jgi:hypothetical protein
VGALHPHTNLVAPSRNLQNVKVIHVDQPAEKRATPYRIHVLPLFETTCFQTRMYMQDVLCSVTERTVQLKC